MNRVAGVVDVQLYRFRRRRVAGTPNINEHPHQPADLAQDRRILPARHRWLRAQIINGASWHIERGIPWRRGYLLYGPPGTGKTSLVKALAGTLDLDVAVINLASPRLDDATLCRLFANAPAHSILLLEDADAAFHHRSHQNANARTSPGCSMRSTG